MKTHKNSSPAGFTLMETVIAIGILAVLLAGFVTVFAPAADGIRRAISTQDADRLTSAVEQEFATLRPGQSASLSSGSETATPFTKAFQWITESNDQQNALVVYQYRASLTQKREDGTGTPVANLDGLPGEDYIVQPIMRRLSDTALRDDLAAVEGAVFVVKCNQLVYSQNTMQPGTVGQIVSAEGTPATDPSTFEDAVVVVAAQFYSIPSKSYDYLNSSAFQKRFPNMNSPLFVRNLAIRR